MSICVGGPKLGMGWNKGKEGEKDIKMQKTVSRVRRNCTRISRLEALFRWVEVEDTGGEWPFGYENSCPFPRRCGTKTATTMPTPFVLHRTEDRNGHT